MSGDQASDHLDHLTPVLPALLKRTSPLPLTRKPSHTHNLARKQGLVRTDCFRLPCWPSVLLVRCFIITGFPLPVFWTASNAVFHNLRLISFAMAPFNGKRLYQRVPKPDPSEDAEVPEPSPPSKYRLVLNDITNTAPDVSTPATPAQKTTSDEAPKKRMRKTVVKMEELDDVKVESDIEEKPLSFDEAVKAEILGSLNDLDALELLEEEEDYIPCPDDDAEAEQATELEGDQAGPSHDFSTPQYNAAAFVKQKNSEFPVQLDDVDVQLCDQAFVDWLNFQQGHVQSLRQEWFERNRLDRAIHRSFFHIFKSLQNCDSAGRQWMEKHVPRHNRQVLGSIAPRPERDCPQDPLWAPRRLMDLLTIPRKSRLRMTYLDLLTRLEEDQITHKTVNGRVVAVKIAKDGVNVAQETQEMRVYGGSTNQGWPRFSMHD